MKINGVTLYKPASQLIVFPRFGAPDIRLEIVAVLDKTEFEKLCPTPVAPLMIKRGGDKVPNFDDKGFLFSVQRQSELYTKWICLQSIKVANEVETEPPTEVEWELVNLQDPKTWNRYEEELIKAGFSDMERTRLQNAVFEVNSLSESKAKEARDTFLQWRQEQALRSSSPTDELDDITSGELVNVSASSLPK